MAAKLKNFWENKKFSIIKAFVYGCFFVPLQLQINNNTYNNEFPRREDFDRWRHQAK